MPELCCRGRVGKLEKGKLGFGVNEGRLGGIFQNDL